MMYVWAKSEYAFLSVLVCFIKKEKKKKKHLVINNLILV